MRFLVTVITLTVWCGVLTVLAKSGIVLSNDTLALTTAIIVAGALAGGDE